MDTSQLSDREKVAAGVKFLVAEWLNKRPGEVNDQQEISADLKSLITWICTKTRISVVWNFPEKMTIAQIVEMFQNAAKV